MCDCGTMLNAERSHFFTPSLSQRSAQSVYHIRQKCIPKHVCAKCGAFAVHNACYSCNKDSIYRSYYRKVSEAKWERGHFIKNYTFDDYGSCEWVCVCGVNEFRLVNESKGTTGNSFRCIQRINNLNCMQLRQST